MTQVIAEQTRVAGIDLLRRPAVPSALPPLVLLHGIGSDAASWASMIAALDPAIEVIAWDAPGYGGSAPVSAASPTPTDYADRLADTLDAFGLDRIVLVGHSLGALFAARFAVRHPDRVSALALLSPALGYGIAAGATLPPAVQARIADLAALGASEFAARRSPRLVHRPEAKPDIVAGVRRAMAAVNPAGYAQAARALGAGTLLDDAARVTVPTLVAVGAKDVITPPGNSRAVRDALVHARPLTVVPDAGHALPQEAPVQMAALLTTLLTEVSGG